MSGKAFLSVDGHVHFIAQLAEKAFDKSQIVRHGTCNKRKPLEPHHMVRHSGVQPDGTHIGRRAVLCENQVKRTRARFKLQPRREKALPPSEAAHKIVPGAAWNNSEGKALLPRRPRRCLAEGTVAANGKNTRIFPSFPDRPHELLRMTGSFGYQHLEGRASLPPKVEKRR